jgi:2-desacetyl-2-hydroxyethyl bacteriochlorophyllide A dehydrogenase
MEVRAEAVLSGISHGTELNLYRGTSPFADKEFDRELRLFRPRTEPAPPLRLGYEWVGRVTETGPDVTAVQAGDLVHLFLPHRESHTFLPDQVPVVGQAEPLPVGVGAEEAIVLALAGVALAAVHDARIKVGDRVAVFGLGVTGLLAVQLARLNGAGWIDAVDLVPKRRRLALAYGADRVLDPAACDAGLEIKQASLQRGTDVAIEVSGHYPALHEAIRSVRKAGTVVAAGFYQGGGTALRLGEEWHHNRITMVSSMAVWDCPHRDYPLWDRRRVNDSARELLDKGRLRTDGLISHRIPFERAAEAYRLIEERPDEVLKVVLTY